MQTQQRIAVLYGGTSAERDVSLRSGQTVAAALAERGHAVELIDPAVTPISEVDWNRFDSAFISLHGTYGEDGQVQHELQAIGVPYTGSDAAASAIAFDKWAAKQRFAAVGVATPAARLVRCADDVVVAAAEIGYPLVVKPCSQGSSVGVTIVREPGTLEVAAEECFRHDTRGLVETAIVGEEWTVGLIDHRPLIPIRITPARGFYDYEAKYRDDRTGYHIADEETSPTLIAELQDVARRAGESLGTSGIARVDFRVDESNQPWVLEVNTVPGFTSHSLIPKAATAEGIDFGELCESMLPETMAAKPPVS